MTDYKIVHPANCAWLTLGFDSEGALRDRSMRAGTLVQVADMTFAQSRFGFTKHRYELGGMLIVAPHLTPHEVRQAVIDATFFPFSNSFRRLFTPAQAEHWCRKQQDQGGNPLTGPLGPTGSNPADTL